MAREKTGGRKVGAVNKYSYNVKTKLSELTDEQFVQKIFTDIENIENPYQRVMAQIRVIEFIVPKPRDTAEVETENMLKSALMDRIFPKKED